MALYRNKVLVSGIRDYPAMTWAKYQALPVAQRPKKWICTDRDYTEIPRESVSVTADGSKTYAQVLNSLYALVDFSKTTDFSLLTQTTSTYTTQYTMALRLSNQLYFTRTVITSNVPSVEELSVTGTSYFHRANSSYTDVSSQVPASGTKFTIYY